MHPEGSFVDFDGSPSDQLAFNSVMHSLDDDLMQWVWLCSDNGGISSPTHVVAGIVESGGDST